MPDIFTLEQRHHVMSQIYSSCNKLELRQRHTLNEWDSCEVGYDVEIPLVINIMAKDEI